MQILKQYTKKITQNFFQNFFSTFSLASKHLRFYYIAQYSRYRSANFKSQLLDLRQVYLGRVKKELMFEYWYCQSPWTCFLILNPWPRVVRPLVKKWFQSSNKFSTKKGDGWSKIELYLLFFEWFKHENTTFLNHFDLTNESKLVLIVLDKNCVQNMTFFKSKPQNYLNGFGVLFRLAGLPT